MKKMEFITGPPGEVKAQANAFLSLRSPNLPLNRNGTLKCWLPALNACAFMSMLDNLPSLANTCSI